MLAGPRIPLNTDTLFEVPELRWPSPVRREPGIFVGDASKLVALCASGVQISPSALLLHSASRYDEGPCQRAC